MDNTASNVDALQRQLGADKLKAQQDAELAAATGTGAQQAAAAAYGPDGRPLNPGWARPQPSGTQSNGQPQLTPVATGRPATSGERRSRRVDTAASFSSNIAYARGAEQPQSQHQNGPAQVAASQNPYAAALAGWTAVLRLDSRPRAAGEPPHAASSSDQIPATDYKRPSEVNIDNAIQDSPTSSTRDLTLDTVLMNRLGR